jgi:exodeoxyribonuclease VII small subunit
MKQENSFELALSKLEEIVRHLEKGDLTLDDSLKAFEDGIKWSRMCEQKLNEAKGKVEMLVKDANGQMKEKEFKVEEEK